MRASKWFSRDNGSIGPLEAEDASRVIAAAADVALIVSADGIVQDCAFRTTELENAVEDAGSWAGRLWTDTVTVESRTKAEALLDGALKDAEPHLRHLNHRSSIEGPDVAIEYAAVRANKDGSIIAFGRDLRRLAGLQQRLVDAQQALERDYSTLRQAQARYRGLFQTAPEPLMMLDAQSLRIAEANPAALKLIEQGRRSLGIPFVDLVHADDRGSVLRLLSGMRNVSGSQSMAVRLAPEVVQENPAQAGALTLSATLLLEEKAAVLVLRLTSAPSAKSADPSSDVNDRLLTALEHAPDGFLVTTHDVAVDGQQCFGFVIRDVGRRVSAQPERTRPLPRSIEQLTELIGRVSMKELVRDAIDVIERLCIESALELTSNNRASAAEMLGLSRQSLYVKLRRYGLSDPGDSESDGETGN
jgi:PAS domain-containing protein/DNA-binding protein Fis